MRVLLVSKMDLKILKFLVTVLICSRLTHQITTPEDRCQISESGFVCIDCFTKGSCLLDEENETYSVIFESSCQNTPAQFYCDDTVSHPQNFGSCSLLDAAATDCSCSSSSQCIADVNNPGVVLHCEADTPVSDPPCFFPSLDLDTCNCASFSDDNCFFIKDPSDDCASYFVVINQMLTGPYNCSAGTCFNQSECKCVITPLTCPDGCLFTDNPDGNCSSYYICNGDNLTPANCAAGLCFDQESCNCIPTTTISSSSISSSTISSSTISPTNCSKDCPLLENPEGNCQSYFVCDEAGLTPVNCSDNWCFDQEACGCVPATESTAIPPTCPPGCPFVDDPNDNCQSYFVCSDSGLTQANCTTNLCFDQESCGCVIKTSTTPVTPTTGISSTTITPPITCPSGCPYADDPNDNCSKFFICDGTILIPEDCPGSLCFVQETCQCQ